MTKSNDAVRHEKYLPRVLQTLGAVYGAMAEIGIDKRIVHLIKLRASQINQCAHCVKMHTAEARADGETSDRLDRLVVWRHVDDFTNEEKSALGWTEALTSLDPRCNYGVLRSDLRQYFSDEAISVLTTEIAMINLWNRFQISNH